MIQLKEILKATKGNSASGNNISFTGISTDTRTIKKGALYLALKGDNFDGHDFISEAFAKGAKGAVVSKPQTQNPKSQTNSNIKSSKILIIVPDTLKALQDIAHYHRNKLKTKVVAVTGSSGKTTTKDMIASVLSKKGRTLKTEENLNNEIGVPLTLLKLTKQDRFAVIEMGMQGLKEIEVLSKMTEPDVAVITNIGKAHLERLKTRMNIARAKGEIFMGLKKRGTAVLNTDDDFFSYLSGLVKRRKVVSFGIENSSDIKAVDISGNGRRTVFTCDIPGKRLRLSVPLPGMHNIYNALCAVAVGRSLGLGDKMIASGLSSFKPSSKRMDIRTNRRGIVIINDTYNANPASMAAALEVLALQKGRRIAVLGDMLELGGSSIKEHENIGLLIPRLKIDILITSGDLSKFIHRAAAGKKPGGKYFHCKDHKSAIKILKTLLSKGDAALFKASRGMKFEKIAENFLT